MNEWSRTAFEEICGDSLVRLPIVLQAKQILCRSLANSLPNKNVPKGYLAVFVGEMEKKRFLVPVSHLNRPSFQDLLRKAEEEFGFDHPMGGLTVPCAEDTFLDLTSQFDRSYKTEPCDSSFFFLGPVKFLCTTH
ncbi:Small auxin-up RNA [Dillenia turbinata]|uniref:Small auxin-up RNA n=1 Tax=Dillenia turbinata TaxID=194707 RepID=A0AAN8UWB3_9MAGN